LTRSRTVGWLIIAVLLTVGFGAYGAYQANIYYNGEAVTAHVDSCETHRVYSRHGSHNETTCHGSWQTADGQHHSGEIDGLGSQSDEGTDVRVRVSGDTAIEDSPFELWPLGVAAVGLLLAVLSIVAVRAAWRRPRPMTTTVRGGPPPYQPYPYGGQRPPQGQPFPHQPHYQQPPYQQQPPPPYPPPPGYRPPSGGYPTPRR
jgi:hypothetical protein